MNSMPLIYIFLHILKILVTKHIKTIYLVFNLHLLACCWFRFSVVRKMQKIFAWLVAYSISAPECEVAYKLHGINYFFRVAKFRNSSRKEVLCRIVESQMKVPNMKSANESVVLQRYDVWFVSWKSFWPRIAKLASRWLSDSTLLKKNWKLFRDVAVRWSPAQQLTRL